MQRRELIKTTANKSLTATKPTAMLQAKVSTFAAFSDRTLGANIFIMKNPAKVFLVLFLFSACYGVSQNVSGKKELILEYNSGCQGRCESSFDDTCSSQVIEIHETARIYSFNGKYYNDSIPLSINQSYKLESFLNSEKILSLSKIVQNEATELKDVTVPPKRRCFHFENFIFNYKSTKLTLCRIDNKMNRNGNYLGKEDNSYIDELKTLIK
jgi:hypothetical protein